MNPFLTAFVPAHNEAGNLEGCVEVVLNQMASLNVSTEVLIVNDGSVDRSGDLADRLAERYQEVRVFHHPYRLGVGGAFLTALQHARGEWMILIPADLALEPTELYRYIEAAPQADIVVGLRSDRSDYNMLRRIVSYTNIFLIQTLFKMKLRQFQYISMYRLTLLCEINIEYWRSAFFLPEILIKARDLGKRLVEVEIRYAPRLSGKPTGAKFALILRTVFDMLRFWIRWARQGQLRRYAGY